MFLAHKRKLLIDPVGHFAAPCSGRAWSPAQHRPRGGTVDAAVFKTVTLQGCGFESHRGHHITEVAMPRAPNMTDLRARLDGVRREIEKLQAQEALLLDLLDETPKPVARARKGSVKTVVLKLLEEVEDSGLNAASAVEKAKADQGIDLDRGSVSSLLSRLKSDGVVIYDGDRYRLNRFAMPRSVTPLRTSGDNQF